MMTLPILCFLLAVLAACSSAQLAFFQAPGNRSFVEGLAATFVCQTENSSQLVVDWLSDGAVITSGQNRRQILMSRVPTLFSQLTINAVIGEDAGRYACRVTNTSSNDSISTEVYLTIVFRPVAMVSPSPELGALNNTDAIFLCHTSTGTPPFNFSWSGLNGAAVTTGIVSTSTQSELTLPNVSLILSQTPFRCTVTLDRTTPEPITSSALSTLVVQVPPTIDPIADVRVNVGGVTLIHCDIRASPVAPVSGVSFTHGSTVSPPTSDTAPFVPAGQVPLLTATLRIAGASIAQDEGLYTCQSRADLVTGESTATQSFTVTVSIPPVIQRISSNTTVVTEATQPIFECVVRARPAPAITWLDPSGQEVSMGTGAFAVMLTGPSADFVSTSQLQFATNAVLGQQGTYTCRASNVADTVQDTTALIVLEPPVAVIDPLMLTVNNGTAATLTCSTSSGTGPFSFQWFDNTNAITTQGLAPGSNQLQLTIDPALFGVDDGTYRCVVTSQPPPALQRNSTSTANLVIYAPPQITPINAAVIGVTRMPAKLAFNFTFIGFPAVTAGNVTWTRDGDNAFTQSAPPLGHDVSADGLCLNFDSVLTADAGTYVATACNVAGCASTQVMLVEEGPPMLVTGPQNRSIDENSVQTFTCSAVGLPTPNITWRLNGSEIQGGASTFTIIDQLSADNITITSTLSFTAVFGNSAGNGQYACVATNTQPPGAIASATLRVFTRPVLELPPTARNLIQQNTAMFTCEFTSVPVATVTWFRSVNDTEEVLTSGTPSNAILQNAQLSDSRIRSSLNISNVSLADIAFYECRASHSEPGIQGSASSQPTLLVVFVGPVVTESLMNATVTIGNPVSFTCEATGNPAPNITWFHSPPGSGVRPLTATDSSSTAAGFNTLGLSSSNLTIANVDFSDRGEYSCFIATNLSLFSGDLNDPITASPIATLIVNVPVQITEISSAVTVVALSSTNISCTTAGFPLPTIQWLVPGRIDPIMSPSNVTVDDISVTEMTLESGPLVVPSFTSELAIFDAQRLHNGTYICVALSAAGGEVRASTDITVQEVPDQPQAPIISGEILSRQFTVSWTPPPPNNAPIQRYTVNIYSNTFGQMFNRTVAIDTNSPEFASRMTTFSSLLPFVTYSVRVRALNLVGESLFSDALEVVTAEEVPAAGPNITQLVAVSNTTVDITFDEVPEQQRNGIITNYTVTYTSQEADEITTVRTGSVVTGLRSVRITGLDVFSRYQFAVRALTRIGAGPSGTAAIVMTLTGFSDPVVNLTASVLSSTSIRVEWDMAVYTNGQIIGYSITQVRGATGNTAPPNPPRPVFTTNDTQIRLGDLAPFTSYTFIVTASTSAGPSQAVASTAVVTSEDVPTNPHTVRVTPFNSTAVSVTLEVPLMQNGDLLDYQYSVIGQSRFVSNGAVHRFSGALAVEPIPGIITGLMGGFRYTITLQAATSVGTSSGVVVPFNTAPAAPATPTLPPGRLGAAPESQVLHWMLFEFPQETGAIGLYHVIVVPLGTVSGVSPGSGNAAVDYPPQSNFLQNTASLCAATGNNSCGYIALEVSSDQFVNGQLAVAIGDGRTTTNRTGGTMYVNSALASEHFYTIFQRGFVSPVAARRRKRQDLTNENYRQFTSSPYFPTQSTTAASDTSIIGALIGGIIGGIVLGALVVLLIVYFVRRRKRKGKYETRKAAESNMDMVIVNPVMPAEVTSAKPAGAETFEEPMPKRVGSKRKSRKEKKEPPANRGPIPVGKFAKHTQEMYATEGFAAEYQLIHQLEPKGMSAEACNQLENRMKNRYANIIAYDSSRVMLPKVSMDNTDYINANWLDGYRYPREYIATQGPVTQSIVDFWRMVWETKAKTIAMVTNLEENGKLKCNQYWPAQGGIIYGDLVVTLTSAVVQSHFTVRTFQIIPEVDLNKGNRAMVRDVKQFHFTSWPDHGVPTHPTPLLMFWQRMRNHQPREVDTNTPSSEPIIVHCSAGVGRTGTLVVIDTMITRARVEGNIDVFSYVLELRRQRNFMVQTESQYRFIHDVLLEYLSHQNTEVAIHDLKAYVGTLKMTNDDGDTNVEVEFKHLSSGVPIRSPIDSALKPFNKKKNRNPSFVPYNAQPNPAQPSAAAAGNDDQSRVRLPMAQAGVDGSDYINASFIDSYSVPGYFIATQGPLPTTTADFWSMVWAYESTSIVMLSNLREKAQEHSTLYWPSADTDPANSTYGDIDVKFEKETILTDFAIRDLSITNTKEHATRSVRQFHYIGWPERGVPASGASLISMIGHVERQQLNTGNKPVVVHCVNGSGRTGAFIAVSSSIDRAKSDNTVDVFQTVKMMRLQRMGTVQSPEQYMFIYTTVLEYINSFDTYSNFS